jgi:choline kinase
MQAVILAAGNGRRLGDAAAGLPKGLLRVGPCSLLEHQVRTLRLTGITRVCVVVGFGAEAVRGALGNQCEYVVNERYTETNSLYSLWLTRRWVTGPFVQMNCDVLAHPQILARVAGGRGSALAYDSTSGREEEHMKVRIEEGIVRSISKRLAPDEISGESVGVLAYDGPTAGRLFDAAEEILAEGGTRAWAPAAVDRIAAPPQTAAIRAVDVSDLPWCEIDFPDDLAHARQQVWPAISGEAAHRRDGVVTVVAPTSGGAIASAKEIV